MVELVSENSSFQTSLKKLEHLGTSLVAQWLSLPLPSQGARVRSLDRELRAHMPRSAAKNKQKKLEHLVDLAPFPKSNDRQELSVGPCNQAGTRPPVFRKGHHHLLLVNCLVCVSMRTLLHPMTCQSNPSTLLSLRVHGFGNSLLMRVFWTIKNLSFHVSKNLSKSIIY